MAHVSTRILLTDIAMGESPRWHDGQLWFCDWGAFEVIRTDPRQPTRDVVARVSTMPACIDWLPDGQLLIMDGGRGALLRQEPDGALTTYADLGGLSPYPWNEVVVARSGNAYVNNIGAEFPAAPPSPGAPPPGHIAVARPDGTAEQVADRLAFPNGMVISPDGVLVVAESHGARLTAFDIAADGSLTNRRAWAELAASPTTGGRPAPDGLCLDPDGAIWYADVPNQECVLVAEGGRVLRSVAFDLGCFSCALGDDRTLYVTAADWTNLSGMTGGPRTGQLLAVDV
jgi:sugar lactone lactonase YvrE